MQQHHTGRAMCGSARSGCDIWLPGLQRFHCSERMPGSSKGQQAVLAAGVRHGLLA